jgi:LEA14-like dessication related protein
LSPKRAAITSISPDGVAFEVVLETTNPNDFDLTAGDVTAHFVLDGHIDVGTATFPQTITLPANATKDIDVPISIHWGDLLPLLEIAASNRPTVPYAVDGTLSLGGDLLHIQVPFHLAGTVTREQIARATVQSIPGLPGLSIVPGMPPGPPPARRAPSHASP